MKDDLNIADDRRKLQERMKLWTQGLDGLEVSPLLSYGGDNLNMEITYTPVAMPYQKIYDGGEWYPCLIIDGPDPLGYGGGCVVLDAKRALEVLEFLQKHKTVLEQM